MSKDRWLRLGLLALAASSFYTGLWALLAPSSWFRNFPGLDYEWVAALPPYNQHLAADVGQFFTAFGVLLVWSAVTLQRQLVLATLVSSLVFAVPHLIFHANHPGGLEGLESVANYGALTIAVVLPLLLLVLAGGRAESNA